MLLINNDDVTKLLSMKDCVEALEVAKEQPLMGNLDRRLRRLESQQQACNHWNGQHPNVLLVNPKLDEVALMETELAGCPTCRRRGGPPKIFILVHPELECTDN